MPVGSSEEETPASSLAGICDKKFSPEMPAQKQAALVAMMRHTSLYFSRSALPPPTPGYEYPRPTRLPPKSHQEGTYLSLMRDPARNYREVPFPMEPRVPPPRSTGGCGRVVDGCELAEQEREMVLKAKQGLPSEEIRNRDWLDRRERLREMKLHQETRLLRR